LKFEKKAIGVVWMPMIAVFYSLWSPAFIQCESETIVFYAYFSSFESTFFDDILELSHTMAF